MSLERTRTSVVYFGLNTCLWTTRPAVALSFPTNGRKVFVPRHGLVKKVLQVALASPHMLTPSHVCGAMFMPT